MNDLVCPMCLEITSFNTIDALVSCFNRSNTRSSIHSWVTFIQVHPLSVHSYLFYEFMCKHSQSILIKFPIVYILMLHARCFLISLHHVFLFQKVKQLLSLEHFPSLSLVISHRLQVLRTSSNDTSKFIGHPFDPYQSCWPIHSSYL